MLAKEQANWQSGPVEERQWVAVSYAAANLSQRYIILKTWNHHKHMQILWLQGFPQAVCSTSVYTQNGKEEKEFYKPSCNQKRCHLGRDQDLGQSMAASRILHSWAQSWSSLISTVSWKDDSGRSQESYAQPSCHSGVKAKERHFATFRWMWYLWALSETKDLILRFL